MRTGIEPIDPYVPERGNAGYDARHYDLDLDYTISSNHLRGRALIHVDVVEDLARLDLDLVGLRATKVKVDGRPARWRQSSGKLRITPASPVAAGRSITIEVRYDGTPGPTRSTWGPVGWEELTDGILVAAQPTGAATWFPCNDLASQKASFDLRVTTATPYRVVANGTLVDRRNGATTSTWTFHQGEPTSPYLMTLNLGRYEERTLPSSPVPMRLLASGEDMPSVVEAFRRQPEMMDVFIDRFGPYPFDAGYTAVVCPEPLEVPLEAQGQAIFGTNHLDPDYERLIAHELSHQWFGNSITAERWRDVWLHEGFACYAEWIWSEASGGETADDLARHHHARLSGLPQDLLLGDPGPVDMFDDRVYKRGALTVHVLRRQMGDDAFFDLLRTWTAEHRHGLITTAGFEALLAASDPSLVTLLRRWLDELALPDL